MKENILKKNLNRENEKFNKKLNNISGHTLQFDFKKVISEISHDIFT